MTTKFFKLTVAAAAVTGGLLSMASAQETDYADPAQYAIDWNGGYLEVTAIGASDPAKAINQADDMKQASAVACDLALEKIAEIIGGVSVTGKINLKNVFSRHAVVKQKVDAFITGSRVLKSKVDILEDGSALATCVRGVRLRGSDSIAARTFSIPAVKQAIAEAVAAVPASAKAASAAPVPVPAGKAHTGLIVDVRGLNSFKNGLTVGLISESGQRLYGADVVSAERLNKGEMVKYCLSEEDARKSADWVGANPLVVKAVAVIEASPETVSISAGDAQRLQADNARAGYLKKGNVIFII